MLMLHDPLYKPTLLASVRFANWSTILQYMIACTSCSLVHPFAKPHKSRSKSAQVVNSVRSRMMQFVGFFVL